jgi:beta-N-acetylhexosaminidase
MSDGIVRSGDQLPRRALPRGGLAAVGAAHAREPRRRHDRVGRALLLSCLLGLGGGLFLCLACTGLSGSATAASLRTEVPRRVAAPAGSPSVRELVGQRFMVAMKGTTPSPSLLERIGRGEVGGVILFGANTRNRAQLGLLTAALQRAALRAGRPPLLIATDQEGGSVRRLQWAGPALSAAELGRLAPSAVQAEARSAGVMLRLAGVNVDLAPVGDVPAPGSFMARDQRTFAPDATGVARATVAFARGLEAARVAATVKHFPGIGRATRNTDRDAVAITAGRAELSRTDLLPFRAAIAAGVPIVMISNATYPALDSKPAPWSPRIQSLLRRDLGFTGVTITDALDGAAATRDRTLPAVTTLAAQAGIDLLLLTGSEASSAAAFDRVVAVADQGRISGAALRASYDRILALKGSVG